MATIRTLNFRTAVDLGGFESGIKRMEAVTGSVASGLGAKLAGIKPALGSIELGFGQIAKAAVASSLAMQGLQILKDIAGWTVGGVKGASDLNESLNKTNVLLGSAAPAVTAFADEMASKYGMVKGDTLEVSTAIATLGKGLGKLDGEQLGKFSTDLTKLAANVGSIRNMDLKAVGDAFRVGLSGEQSDVLKSMGVALTETTVKAYALSHGIGKVDQALTEQQKLMARAGLLTEKLAFANGDLDNTINDPANAYRKLTGSLTNFRDAIGATLLPAVKVVAGIANGLVARMTGAFDAIKPAVERFGETLAGGFRVVGAALDYIGPAWAEFVGTMAGAFGQVIGAVGSMVGSVLPSVADVAGGLKGYYLTMTGGLNNVIAAVRSFPEFVERSFGTGPATVFKGLVGVVGTVAGAIRDGISWAVGAAGFAIRNLGDLFGLGMIRIGQGVDVLLKNLALIPENLGRIGSFVANNFVELMTSSFIIVGRAVESLASAFWDFLKDLTGGIKLNVDAILSEFRALAAKLPKLAVAQAIDVTADVQARHDSMARTEADYQANLGKPFAMPKPPTAPATDAAAASASARVAADVAKAAVPEVTEELAKYAKDLAEKTKSPLAKFEELMDNARKARAAGLINGDQFKKAEAFNRKEAGLGDTKFSGAVELGSKEAYSSLVSALYGRGESDANKVAQQGVREQQQTNRTLNQINRKLGADTNPIQVVNVA